MTDQRDDIAQARSRLRWKLGGSREINRLEHHVDADERVLELAVGRYGPGQGILVLTDRRLVFYVDGVVKKHTEDFPFRTVSSVAWQSGLGTGTIIISSAGARSEIKSVMKEDGKRLVDAARSLLANYGSEPTPSATPQADVMVQLQQLGQLRDAGVLTDAEFEAKKAELLSRL